MAWALAVAAGALGLASCALVETLDSAVGQLDRRIDATLKRQGLMPRVEQLGDEDDARREQHCEQRSRPALSVIQHDVFPANVTAGKHANHRFTYALCPATPGAALSGDLVRRVYYKNRQIMSDVTKDADLKPGVWRVDAFFEIPTSAVVGSYEVEVQFVHPAAGFRERAAFTITPPPSTAD